MNEFSRFDSTEDRLAEAGGAQQERKVPAVDLEGLVRAAPEGLAACVIELSTGMPLQVTSLVGHPSADFDHLAAATSELFQGSSVTAIERMDLEHQESVDQRRKALRQVIVQSNHLLYIFLRSHRNADLVLATLCRAEANLGLALMAARASLRELEGGR